MLERHPEIGFRMLEGLGVTPVADWVLHHHERWDGRGYPDRLPAEEIPLGARILFVADAFDAMTSDRPYRKAMSRAAAITELRRQAGTQFDPKLVDVFLKVIEQLDRAVSDPSVKSRRPAATSTAAPPHG